MEKNKPIRDQLPNKHRVPIVKNPCFSWLYGLAKNPADVQKCWGPQNKFSDKF